MMRKATWLVSIGAMVAVAAGFYLWSYYFSSSVGTPVVEMRYELPRTLRYSYTLSNQSNRLVKGVDFWVYAPVKQTATQRVESMTASYPYTMIEDRHGNQIMHFHFDAVPPYDNKVITIKTQLSLAQERNQVVSPLEDLHLMDEPFIEVSAAEIQVKAAALKREGPMATAQSIYTWLIRNVKYSGYVRDDHGALYALKHRQGDCTEYMNLFSALSRANGIQARGVGGYVLKENAVVKPADYHNWAEFYADDSWYMVDAQEKVFVERQHEYIAMRIIGEDESSPLNGVHRFRVAGDGIEVVMN